MKRILLWMALAAAMPAWAQAPAPEMKPQPEAKKEAAKPAAKKRKPAVKMAAKKHRRWHEDARHCLERASNTDVIKCAEDYL
jgi:hypothetical protein